jgi:hypothetical protein
VSADGIGSIAPGEGLALLERLMGSASVQATVLPVDWAVFAERNNPIPPFYSRVARPRQAAQPAGDRKAPDAATFVSTLLDTPAARREKVLSAHVRELAARVLGGGRARTIDARVPLNEVGLDSLMAVELRNLLGASVGRTLPATLLFDHPTIDALTSHLLTQLMGSAAASPSSPAPATATDLIDRMDELSDEEIDRLLAERMAGANS